ncbi:hypothetical protein [Acinetobacter pittii]
MITEINVAISDELRACQLESMQTIKGYLKSPLEKSCLISLPIGAGKNNFINHYSIRFIMKALMVFLVKGADKIVGFVEVFNEAVA